MKAGAAGLIASAKTEPNQGGLLGRERMLAMVDCVLLTLPKSLCWRCWLWLGQTLWGSE